MKVALYTRVSTKEQTVENQLPQLVAWVKARGHEITGVYTENESAWKVGHQKELARLLNDLQSGKRKYDVLLVWALDRLTRQGISSILSLMNQFKLYGCQVISLREPWTETGGMMTELLNAIVGWAANYEVERLSVRTKVGQARAVANGKKLGRPPGKKDKTPRKTTGYLLRYATK
jgi:putative DNA-invertase from lambdoid prophage Rac